MGRHHLAEVAQILGLEARVDQPLRSFQVDSRLVDQGDLFFALPGQRADGHAFLGDVASKGVSGAVVNKSYSGPDFGLLLLRVDDPLESLQSLARHSLQRRHNTIIAITGSIGKTTTKEFLAALLRQKYRVGASRTNHNSQIGLPLTLLNDMTGDEEVLVLEMGMTHPGNLSRLLSVAPADISIMTTAALVHAERFDSIEHLALTKAEIFNHPKTALGVIHRDLSNFDEVAACGACAKMSFSLTNPDADFYLDAQSEELAVVTRGQRHPIGRLLVPGTHHRHNLLAAIAVARSLGVEWDQISAAIPSLQLPDRRMQMLTKSGVLFINDSYNACDVSVKAALSNLPAGGRKIAVLGTMPELGKFSDACHRDVGLYALGCVDHLFCYGVECQPMIDVWNARHRPAQLFTDRRLLVAALETFLQSGDVALIKGANTKKMWEIIDEIALPG